MPDMLGDWGRGMDADESPETRGEVTPPAQPAAEVELLDYDGIVHQIQQASLTLLPGLLAELVKRQVTTPFMRDDKALHNLVDRTLMQARATTETWTPEEEAVLQALQKVLATSEHPSDATREAIRLLQNQKTRVKFPLPGGV